MFSLNISKAFVIGAVVAVALLAIYAPIFLRAFDYHDAFYAYAYPSHEVCKDFPQYKFFLFVGRPGYAYLNCFLVASWIDSIGDSTMVRLVTFCVLAASAVWFCSILRRLGCGAVLAVAMAVSAFSMPGLMVVMSVTQANPIVYTLPLVLGAFSFIARAIEPPRPELARPRHRIFLLASSVVLLVVTSLIYQQFSGLIFALAFVAAFLSSAIARPRWFTWLGVTTAVYALHGVIYLILHRGIFLPMALELYGKTEAEMVDDERSVAFSTDIFDKVRLFGSIFRKSLDLWVVGSNLPIWMLSAVMLALVAGGMIWLDRRSAPDRGIRSSFAQSIIYAVAFLLLAISPTLIAKGNSTFYRHIVPCQWMILFFAALGADCVLRLSKAVQLRMMVLGAVAFAAVLGSVYSNWNLSRNIVMTNAGEIEFLSKKLRENSAKLPGNIIVVQTDLVNIGAYEKSSELGDEFGLISSMHWQDTPWLIRAALIKAGFPWNAAKSVKVVAASSEPPDIEGALTIDMREYTNQFQRKKK